MDDFLQETQKQSQTVRKGLRYVFVLVFAIALLWQVVSFIQLQLNQYHQALVKDFKVILTVAEPLDNEVLNALGQARRTGVSGGSNRPANSALSADLFQQWRKAQKPRCPTGSRYQGYSDSTSAR